MDASNLPPAISINAWFSSMTLLTPRVWSNRKSFGMERISQIPRVTPSNIALPAAIKKRCPRVGHRGLFLRYVDKRHFDPVFHAYVAAANFETGKQKQITQDLVDRPPRAATSRMLR